MQRTLAVLVLGAAACAAPLATASAPAHASAKPVASAAPSAPLMTAAAPPTLDDALAEGARTHRPVIVEFSTRWCGPCRIMQRRILEDATVRALLPATVFVRYDAEVGPGIDAAQRYGVHSYPTTLWLDDSGHVHATGRGAPTLITTFIEFISRAAVSTASPAAFEADTTLALPVRLYLAAFALDRSDPVGAAKLYARARHADATGAAGIAPIIIWHDALATHGSTRRTVIVGAAIAIVEAWPASTIAQIALPVVVYAGGLPAARMAKILEARRLAVRDDAYDLNGLVYLAIGAGQFDEAIAAGEAQVRLSPDEANAYDTLAEAYHSKHDNTRAVATARLAVMRASPKERASYEGNLHRFEMNGSASPDAARETARIDTLLDPPPP